MKSFAWIILLILTFTIITVGQVNNSFEYWKKQRLLSLEERNAPIDDEVEDLDIPNELYPKNTKQQADRLAKMQKEGFKPFLDYTELAAQILSGELVLLDFVNENYLCDLGLRADGKPFTKFSFSAGSVPLKTTDSKFKNISQLLNTLVNLYTNEKHNINSELGRRQFKQHLLGSLTPKAKSILEEIAKAYKDKFNRPLRITSATRTIEYQILLSNNTPNSFKPTKGSIPSHTTGYAFDFSYSKMTAQEQDFIMKKLAKMEGDGILVSIRESGDEKAFHIFVYP